VRAIASVAVIDIVGWWSWSPHRLDPDELRVTFLDVWQGDAAVLELPGGTTVLIDGGAAYDTLDMGRAVVAPY
jgi:competence protein ComEC